MRLAAAVVACSALACACATPQVGSWRADGAPPPADFQPPPPQGFHKSRDHGTTAEGFIACLGSAAIVGGAGAVIYLTRYKGRLRGGGAGGDVGAHDLELVPPTLDAAAAAAPAADVPVAHAGSGSGSGSGSASASGSGDAGAPAPCGAPCGTR